MFWLLPIMWDAAPGWSTPIISSNLCDDLPFVIQRGSGEKVPKLTHVMCWEPGRKGHRQPASLQLTPQGSDPGRPVTRLDEPTSGFG